MTRCWLWLVVPLFLGIAGCGDVGAADKSDRAATASAAPTGPTAAQTPPLQSDARDPAIANSLPAQPAAGEISAVTRVIAKRPDTDKDGKEGCRIVFAYAGREAEEILWRGETCEEVTASFVDRADLERLGKWERLDDYARERIALTPGKAPLWVEGTFTASIYPLDFNGLTYEVEVAD